MGCDYGLGDNELQSKPSASRRVIHDSQTGSTKSPQWRTECAGAQISEGCEGKGMLVPGGQSNEQAPPIIQKRPLSGKRSAMRIPLS
jgi:hypothetical protein